MEHVAETNTESTTVDVQTKISGIGNTKTPVLIAVSDCDESYLTDVELASASVTKKACGDDALTCHVRFRTPRGEGIAADVYLEDGDAYVNGAEHGHINVYLEPRELSRLRLAVYEMLTDAATVLS